MPRIPRGQQAGNSYHIINRGNGRATVFHKCQDYEAFLSLLGDAKERHPVKILAFCLMPNHFALERSHEKALSQFMQRLYRRATSGAIRSTMAVVALSGKDDSRTFPYNVTSICLSSSGMWYRIPFELVCDAVQHL